MCLLYTRTRQAIAAAEALKELIRLGKRYAGEKVSGEAYEWSLKQYGGEEEKAIALAEYLISGGMVRTALMDRERMRSGGALFFGHYVIDGILKQRVIAAVEEKSSELMQIMMEEGYEAEYEATGSEKEGEHWRVYVSKGNVLEEYNGRVSEGEQLEYAERERGGEEREIVAS